MEKYRKFADHTTGIQPFLEIQQKKKPLLLKLLGCIFLLIRLPFFIAFLLIKISCTFLIQLILKPLLKDFYSFDQSPNQQNYPEITSIYSWIFQYSTRKKKQFKRFNAVPLKVCFASDSQSPQVDLNAYFKFITSKLKMLINPQECIFESQTQQNLKKYQNKLSITKSYPSLLFIEGCQTNGLGFLQLDQHLIDQLYSDLQQTNTQLILLIFQYGKDVPINPNASGIWILVKLMMNLYNSVKIKQFGIKEIPATSEEFASAILKFYESHYTYMKIDWTSYNEFKKYWKETQCKGYQKKEQ